VYTFLHNFRGTIIIALALPTSMIATFAALYACNFTLNTMTLLGLSLSVGILIDDAIVVLENISRHLALGEEPTQAAINGRSEIGMAAITLTTVDLVVFLPIAFMGGVIGEFFRSFGVTVACATFFSLMVSFTLTPMLAARWYKKGESFEYHTGFAGWFDSHFFAFEKFYQGILKNLLSRWWRPWIVVAVGFAFLIAVVVTVVPKIGFRFSPDQDQNQVNISVQGPAGASLDYTHVIVNRIQNIIRTTPDLNRDTKFILTSEGKSARGQGNGITGTQYATVLLVLYDRSSFLDTLTFWHHEHLRPRSDIDVALELRKLTGKIPGARILCSNVSGFGGGGPPLEVDLTAPDFNQLLDASNRVEALVRSTPGTYNTDISYQNSEPEVQIRLDRVRVTQYGLDLQTVSNAVSDAVAGNISSYYRDPNDGEEYYIRVELAKNYRDNPTYMGALIVGYQNGAPVHLSDVANITFAAGPVKIDRLNRVHEIAVTAYLLPGYQVGNISTALGAKLSKMNLGQVGFTFGGEAQSLSDEGGYLITALLLGIILSYMLMAALFDNALYPISIMGALPQAWGGALIALYIAKEPLNLIAMIGVVLLNGIVNKNAILLVDYTNTLRKRGYTRADALSEAGPVRLRPIMMTSIAILMSSLPTALALGRGAGFRQSLGVVVIGGVCLSTFLTLLVIPCAYTIFDTFQEWFGRMKRRLLKLDRDEDDFGGGGLREPYSRKGSDDPLAGITADGRKPDNIAP
jgi:HAE1 family hydrophobic/amphiphilic exporter-1